MAGIETAMPVCDLRPDADEPEEEDARRRRRSSSALIVKPPPLQVADVDHPVDAELVYPWVASDPGAVSVISDSAMMTSPLLYATAVRSEPGPHVATALLPGNNSQSVHRETPLGYGTNVKMQRRHSILRMSPSKTGHALRKSASVEFVLDHAHREIARSIHASTSSIGREPRRLTVEEKEELYRVRPDLEIGPVPYYNEKVEELNRRNQRRIIFAMFGGMISIILLLVFFSMLEKNK